MKKILILIRNYANEGLFHIFGSSVLAQVGALISSFLVVRWLPKINYGNYVAANNWYSYIVIFIGLGMVSAGLQYCSENVAESRKNAIHTFALRLGTGFNVFLSVAILVLAYIENAIGNREVSKYLLIMCLLPFFVFINNYLQIILRVKFKNKMFSYANISYTAVMVVGNIVLTKIFGVPGLIISYYLAYSVAIIICIIALKSDGFFMSVKNEKDKLIRADKKEITSYAFVCTITNFASSVLVLLDVTCLGILVNDAIVLADYKVASAIPAACTFIPSCFVTFFYPKMVSAFSSGVNNGKNLLKKLIKIIVLVNFAISLALALFSPLIIWIIYGTKYLNVVPIFQILSLNFLIYSVRNFLGNVIAVLKKVKVNLVISVFSGVLNILLNLILIYNFGSFGAAFSTLITTTVVLLLNIVYLMYYFKKESNLERT